MMKRKKLLKTYTFFLSLLLIISFSAKPCDCPTIPKLDLTYCTQYSLIFKGKITAVSPCNEISKATFKVTDLYKGDCTSEIDVYFDCTSDCMMNLNVGEEWIVYVNFIQHGKPGIKFCTRSRKRMGNDTQTDYVNTEISFDEEGTFLKDKLGLHEFIPQNLNAALSHQNEKPGGLSSIILVLCSIAGFWLIYFLFNKFIK